MQNKQSVKKMIFDARGNGNGYVCNSIVGGHQISISDYTAIVLEIYELSESNRFVNGEQPSGQLLRSGRIQ